MASCMLIEAELEKKFWAEAVVMANYIQNRLPAKDIERTPYENWFGVKPSISHFRRFGSKCYTFIPDEKRRKLDSKAVQTIFVGYDAFSKAYRCFVPSTGKLIVSRDVKFIHKDSDWKNNLDQIQEEHTVEINHEVDVPDEFFSADEESDVDSDENEELTAGDNSLVVPVVKR